MVFPVIGSLPHLPRYAGICCQDATPAPASPSLAPAANSVACLDSGSQGNNQPPVDPRTAGALRQTAQK